MPIINIETLQQLSPSVKKDILKAVHSAAIAVLQLPPDTCHVRWIEIHPDNYFCVTDKPENHFYMEIKLFHGRSLEVKKELYQSLFKVMQDHHLETENLMIALHEITMENWGMCGGQPGSELSFNYKVDI